METNSTQEAKTEILQFIEEVFAEADPDNELQMAAKQKVVDIVHGIESISKVDTKVLFEQVMEKIMDTTEVQVMLTELIGEIRTESVSQLEEARDIKAILLQAERLAWIEHGTLLQMLIRTKSIFFTKDKLEEYFFGYINDADEALVQFLILTMEKLNQPSQTKTSMIRHPFVVLGMVGEEKCALGVDYHDDGTILKVGIASFDAPCRIESFRKVFGKGTAASLGDGLEVIVVEEGMQDYLEGILDPYSLPDELFLLRAAAYWELDIGNPYIIDQITRALTV